MNFDELARIAVENGATKATVIPVAKIGLSSVFRDICKTECFITESAVKNSAAK